LDPDETRKTASNLHSNTAKAQKIIDKYLIDSNCVFPAISNQKFNAYLKEVATITK
jgi:hydroxylamine reductase (hybrid-cluster protein)